MAEVRAIIQDERGSIDEVRISNENPINPSPAPNPAQSKKESKESKSNLKLAAAGMVLVRSASQFTQQNIGTWTGDSHNQTIYNNVVEATTTVIESAVAFAVNPALGFVTLGVKAATTAFSEIKKVELERLEVERARNLAGYSSTGEIVGFRRNYKW